MLKKEITYTDYDGNQRTENHYFNLSKPELIKWQAYMNGNLVEKLTSIVKSGDTGLIMKTYEELIKMSYGIKSEDNKFFDKSEEISKRFMQSAAYETMFMDLFTKEGEAEAFINGIIPADLREQLAQMPQLPA